MEELFNFINQRIIIKMENKNKTLIGLNKTIWYRTIKTIYFLILIPLLLFWGSITVVDQDEDALMYLILIILIAIVLQRAFYYIFFGTIKPKK